MTHPQDVLITAADGQSLCGTLVHAQTPQSAVLLCGATGVKRHFYRAFAEWLAEQGHSVLLFDYRGIGDSLGTTHVKDCDARLQDWGELDMPAALDYLREQVPGVPVNLIGHSAGGQQIGLMPNWSAIDNVVGVAVSSGYVAKLSLKIRYAVRSLFFLTPAMLRVKGYSPNKRLGWGENLPSQVMLQWRKWCSSPGYLKNDFDGSIKQHYFDQFNVPTHWLTVTDDDIATADNVADMARVFTNTSVTFDFINPAELGYKKIGHIFMFSRARKKFWPLILEKLIT